MIKVNSSEFSWQEGFTIEALLNTLSSRGGYDYLLKSNSMVSVNNSMVPQEQYRSQLLQDGDVVSIFPSITGG